MMYSFFKIGIFCPQKIVPKFMVTFILVTNLVVQICHQFFMAKFFGYKMEGSKLGARLIEGLDLI